MWQNKDAFHTNIQDTNWWWGKVRLEIISDIIKDIKVKNILEIGAGYGSMTKMLSSFGNVKAIEPDDGAAKYLKDKFSDNFML
jgi:16S rRNA A1518/A1519 N6-dimethyltransferase RsmA/KsgA/DIM1 with predicted DNA glycosylase/AP lyase activity